jgi:hypothetical protein
MILQKALSGRPSKFDKAMAGKIIREVREGASFYQAAISAGTTFVSIFRWRVKYPWFDKALRTARKQAVGKGRKVGEMPMSKDAFGRPFVSRDQICDEKERQRLIKLRNQLLAGRSGVVAVKAKSRIKRGSGEHDDVVKRLIKLREDYEAKQAQKELGTGNVAATLQALPAPATDSLSAGTPDTLAQSNAVLGETYEPETPTNPHELTIEAEVIEIQEAASPAPPAAMFKADPPMIGGRSPASWREPTNDEDLGSL